MSIQPAQESETTTAESLGGYPDLSNLTTVKIPHRNLVLDGTCSNCAHCWQDLTDAVSVQRGIGPTCSKKGYSEDPVEGDELQAFIALSEYPELVEFLTKHYKPLGLRGLVNGLVRVASLNRPHGRGAEEGNEKVFAACCDAVECLGYERMAALLRRTLLSVWITEVKDEPGLFTVRTMQRKTPGWWWNRMRHDVSGATWDKGGRAHLVRLHAPGNPKDLHQSVSVDPSGNPMSNKLVIWNMMLEAFEGSCADIGGKVVKILPKASCRG